MKYNGVWKWKVSHLSNHRVWLLRLCVARSQPLLFARNRYGPRETYKHKMVAVNRLRGFTDDLAFPFLMIYKATLYLNGHSKFKTTLQHKVCIIVVLTIARSRVGWHQTLMESWLAWKLGNDKSLPCLIGNSKFYRPRCCRPPDPLLPSSLRPRAIVNRVVHSTWAIVLPVARKYMK